MTTSNKTTELKQTSDSFNPYFIDGYQVNSICIYKDGEVLLSTRWFSNSGSNNDYPTVFLPFEVCNYTRKRNKEEKLSSWMQSKEAFFLFTTEKYSSGVDVYIHADLLNFKELPETVYFDNEKETVYKNNFSITVEAIQTKLRIAENVQGYEYYKTEKEVFTIPIWKHGRTVKKEFGLQLQQLEKELTDLGIKNNNYFDVEKLLKLYNVTKK